MLAVFRSGTLYASSALLASGVLVLLERIGMPNIALATSVVVGTGLTLLARERGWRLPNSEEAEELLPDHLPNANETKRWWRRNSRKHTRSGRGHAHGGRTAVKQRDAGRPDTPPRDAGRSDAPPREAEWPDATGPDSARPDAEQPTRTEGSAANEL